MGDALEGETLKWPGEKCEDAVDVEETELACERPCIRSLTAGDGALVCGDQRVSKPGKPRCESCGSLTGPKEASGRPDVIVDKGGNDGAMPRFAEDPKTLPEMSMGKSESLSSRSDSGGLPIVRAGKALSPML